MICVSMKGIWLSVVLGKESDVVRCLSSSSKVTDTNDSISLDSTLAEKVTLICSVLYSPWKNF